MNRKSHFAIRSSIFLLIVMLMVSCSSSGSDGPGSSGGGTTDTSANLVTVPDICDLDRADAVAALDAVGLVAGTVSEQESNKVAIDAVISQSPSAGEEVEKGSAVDFAVSTGPSALTMTTWDATVVLPDGVSVTLDALTVQTALGAYPVDASGNVTVDAYSEGPHVVFVMSPTGNPVLVGMTGETAGTISVNTTAQYLVFIASGLYGAPMEVRSRLLELLQTEDLSALEAAISAALVADIDAFGAYNAAIATALTDTLTALRASADAASTTTRTPASMLIQPSEAKSGIQVDQTNSINTIRLTNMYRRPVLVGIDMVSHIPTDGTETVSEYGIYDQFELEGVTSLGGVLNTVSNLLSGNYAYSYTYSDEYRLPVWSGHKQTNYEVVVMSIGAALNDEFYEQSQVRRDIAFEMAAKYVVFDFVWPLYASIIGPVVDYQGFTDFDWYKYKGWKEVDTLFNTLLNLSDFPEAIWSGDILGAVTIVLNAAAQDAGLQSKICSLMFDVVIKYGKSTSSLADAQRSLETAQKVMNAIRIVDILAASFDLVRAVGDVANSRWCEVWEINVLEPEVVITPETVILASATTYGQDQAFVVTVPDATGSVGDESTFAYSWTVTQTAGTITGHTGETTFDSSSNTITYVANALTDGSDTITVDVYEIIVGDSGTSREYVGRTAAAITVKQVSAETFAGHLYSWSSCEENPGGYMAYSVGWQVGVEFSKITTEPVPTKYHVFGYNFNDTSFHGTSVDFIGPPWPTYAGSGTDTGATWQIGLTGGGGDANYCDYDDLQKSVDWGLSRFEGAIFEITPIY